MARSRTTRSTPVPETVTRDAADILVDALNQIDGISFVRDAWENKAPDDYGVVEMTGQSNALWADNKMQEQTFTLAVHLYTKDGGNAWIKKIQDKLETACDWYTMPTHEFIYEISKNHWTWSAYIIGPMQWEEAAGVS